MLSDTKNAEQMKKAGMLLVKGLEKGHKFNLPTVKIMAIELKNNENLTEAYDLLSAFLEKEYKFNSPTIESLIIELKDNEQIEEADKLLLLALKHDYKEFNIKTIEYVVEKLQSKGQEQEGAAILELALEKGYSLDKGPEYKAIELSHHGKYKEATELLFQYMEANYKFNSKTIEGVVIGLRKVDLSGTYKLLQKSLDKGYVFNPATIENTVINLKDNTAFTKEAYELLLKGIEKDYSFNNVTVNNVLLRLKSKGLLKEASQLIEFSLPKNFHPSEKIVEDIIRALSNKKQILASKELARFCNQYGGYNFPV